MSMSEPVKIDGFNFREGVYTRRGREYRTSDIIEAAKDLKVFNIPLCSIDISFDPWDIASLNEFIYHYRRIENADLSHPIILDDEGSICDGRHRVAKAILTGAKAIKAKRLTVMPEASVIKE